MIKDTDGNDFAELDVMTIGETDEAVRFDDGDNKFWVPKSCMEDWPDLNRTGTVLIQMWFAKKEELI